MTPELRKNPPVPLDPVSFDIPTPFQTTLENGLRLIIIEHDRLPLVSYRLAFQSGDANDPSDMTGLTSAMTSQLTEGTEEYTSLQLAEKVERLGASLNSSSSDDFTIVSASSLSLYGSEMLHLLAEVVLRPTFPENELDLYRRNTVEHLKFQRSQPGFLAGEQAARLIYGAHPYSKVSPEAADIERLTRESVAAFHKARFIPNNAILIVVGDVKREDLVTEIEELFGDWEKGSSPSVEFASPPARTKRSLTIVDRPGSAQANIVITNLGVNRSNPDYFPLIVMNQVLGAGASSRVFMNLREEKGYTYGAYTRLEFKRLAGDVEATAEVRTGVTGDSLREFFYELDRVRVDKVGDDELADAKNFLTGVFPIRAETQEGLTNLIVNQYLYGLPEDYLQTYRDRVEAVTTDDVLRVAAEYLRPSEMAIVIVGDAGEILPQARGFAESVEVYDTEGELQELANYREKENTDTAQVAGKWTLKVALPGQEMSVSMTLQQTDTVVDGDLKMTFGSGKIAGGKLDGNKMTATATAKMMGQQLNLEITGKVNGDAMNGTITVPMIKDPVPFTGVRA